MKLTRAEADYLKTIFTLTETTPRVRTTDLAAALRVSPASVTGMIQKLAAAEPPFLHYRKHQGVTLTEVGRTAALKTIRQHRLVEMFLFKTLGYAWDEVHEEAERLEHVISERLEKRIAASLGNPTFDPHGQPIPTRDLELPPYSTTPLSDALAGQRIFVERVNDNDPALLRHLSGLGLMPGTEIEVEEISPFDGNLQLHLVESGKKTILGPAVTSQVFTRT